MSISVPGYGKKTADNSSISGLKQGMSNYFTNDGPEEPVNLLDQDVSDTTREAFSTNIYRPRLQKSNRYS